MLKPQDLVIVLRLVLSGREKWTYASLATEFGLAPSEVYSGVRRAIKAGLLDAKHTPNRAGLLEVLIHSVRYFFPAERKEVVRGLPTAYAAFPFSDMVDPHAVSEEEPPVWPDPKGKVYGQALLPIHKSVVSAAKANKDMYTCLALIESIRIGQTRERKMAEEYLRAILLPDISPTHKRTPAERADAESNPLAVVLAQLDRLLEIKG